MVKYEIMRLEEFSKDMFLSFRLTAASELSGTGFKLYCYLESFPLGQTRYNRKTFVDAMGIAPKTADFAFEELIEKGFLKKIRDMIYLFTVSRENL